MGKRIPRLQMWPFRSGNFDCSFYTLANFYLGEVQARFCCSRICPGPSSPHVKLSGLQISKVVLFLGVKSPASSGGYAARSFLRRSLRKLTPGRQAVGTRLLLEGSRLFFKARSEPDWR